MAQGFTEEEIGVTALLQGFDAYPDGVQGYHIEDADGQIKITFDTVSVPSGQTLSGLSFQVFFGDTSWESLDAFRAYINLTTSSGSSQLEMVNINDDDVEAEAGSWKEYNTGYLQNIVSYQLVIEGSNSASSEDIFIDNIIVYEPEE